MKISGKDQWDEAGGTLEMIYMTVLSIRPIPKNQKDLDLAIESLSNAKDALSRLGVYSEDFDPLIYHY